MSKNRKVNPNYIMRNPTTTPCTKCGGQVCRVLDERKFACIQCGKAYNQ